MICIAHKLYNSLEYQGIIYSDGTKIGCSLNESFLVGLKTIIVTPTYNGYCEGIPIPRSNHEKSFLKEYDLTRLPTESDRIHLCQNCILHKYHNDDCQKSETTSPLPLDNATLGIVMIESIEDIIAIYGIEAVFEMIDISNQRLKALPVTERYLPISKNNYQEQLNKVKSRTKIFLPKK